MTFLRPERPSLLLADDDQVFCQVLAKALVGRGYDVAVVHDGASALRLIEVSSPEYAVLDLRLPDMSGLKLVSLLKAKDEHTKIVLLTGYASIVTAIDAIKLGAMHYLSKPTTANEIEQAFMNQKPDLEQAAASRPLSVERLEWEHIQRVLTGFDGNISATARSLHMHRRTLQRKLSKRPPHE